jgi:hypothetical protein
MTNIPKLDFQQPELPKNIVKEECSVCLEVITEVKGTLACVSNIKLHYVFFV